MHRTRKLHVFVAILLQVSRVRFLSHHHPHSPPLSGIGGGAVGTPHLFLLTPTYPGDRVVDRCLIGGFVFVGLAVPFLDPLVLWMCTDLTQNSAPRLKNSMRPCASLCLVLDVNCTRIDLGN